MNLQRTVAGLAFVAAILGCSKAPPAPTPPPAPPALPAKAEEPKPAATGAISLTATNEVVREDKMPTAPASRVVRADFNADNIEDIAIADGTNAIAIYVRKPGEGLAAEYYKAGGIQESGGAAISGLMTRKTGEGTDLIVILNYADGRKEMAQYRSDGKQLREYRRDPMQGKPAQPAGGAGAGNSGGVAR